MAAVKQAGVDKLGMVTDPLRVADGGYTRIHTARLAAKFAGMLFTVALHGGVLLAVDGCAQPARGAAHRAPRLRARRDGEAGQAAGHVLASADHPAAAPTAPPDRLKLSEDPERQGGARKRRRGPTDPKISKELKNALDRAASWRRWPLPTSPTRARSPARSWGPRTSAVGDQYQARSLGLLRARTTICRRVSRPTRSRCLPEITFRIARRRNADR